MKKIICIVIILYIAVLNVNALENTEIIDNLITSTGLEQVENIIPDGANEALRETKNSRLSITDLYESLSFDNIASAFTSIFTKAFSKYIAVYVSLFGLMILYMLFNTFKTGFASESLSGVYSVGMTAGVILLTYNMFYTCFDNARTAVAEMSVFMKSMIPVMVTVNLASGSPVASSLSHSLLFGLVELIAMLNSSIFMPLVTVYFALMIASGLSPVLKLDGLMNTVKNIMTWGMGIIMTLFVMIMSLQSVLASSADTIGRKSLKFAVSTFVPVLGGILSDSVDTVLSCAKSVKSLMGVFGIIVIVFIILIPVANIAVNMICINIVCGLGDILGETQVTGFIKGFKNVLGMALAVMLSTAVMLMIAFLLLLLMA